VKCLMFFGLAEPDSKQISRARHAGRTTLEHMRIDHGGLHIAMTKELLNGSDVRTAFQQLGGASMGRAFAMAKTTPASWLQRQGSSDIPAGIN